jgi:hypothetical protein
MAQCDGAYGSASYAPHKQSVSMPASSSLIAGLDEKKIMFVRLRLLSSQILEL